MNKEIKKGELISLDTKYDIKRKASETGVDMSKYILGLFKTAKRKQIVKLKESPRVANMSHRVSIRYSEDEYTLANRIAERAEKSRSQCITILHYQATPSILKRIKKMYGIPNK